MLKVKNSQLREGSIFASCRLVRQPLRILLTLGYSSWLCQLHLGVRVALDDIKDFIFVERICGILEEHHFLEESMGRE